MADVTSERLLQAAQGGDAEALDALLKRYQPQIYRFGMKMCRRPEDAQDVLQETLLAAARTLKGFRGASSVSTWLYAIARSFCIKARRRPASAPPVVSLESGGPEVREAADTAPGPERRLADREVGQALDAAIASLDLASREVLVLRDVEGLSAAEVAAVTGSTVPAVKSRLHRARRAVRERLRPILEPGAAPPAHPAAQCPDVIELLSRHLEGEIDPAVCAEMEQHVAACARCGAACESLRRTLRICGAMAPAEVPEALKLSIGRAVRAAFEARS